MSHSKFTKKGKSFYIDSWNKSAKKYIIECVRCGAKGHKPTILEPGFSNSLERKAIKKELVSILKPLHLDTDGICDKCLSIEAKLRKQK